MKRAEGLKDRRERKDDTRRPFIVDLMAYCAVRFIRAVNTMGGLIDDRPEKKM